jgi:hypothetical protein
MSHILDETLLEWVSDLFSFTHGELQVIVGIFIILFCIIISI